MSDIDNLKQQVLNGKTLFGLADVPDNDPDTFMSLVAEPLRKLKYAGMFDQSEEELWNHADGKSYIFAVDIIGAINFNFDVEEGTEK